MTVFKNIKHLTGRFLLAGVFVLGTSGSFAQTQDLDRLKRAIDDRQAQEEQYRKQAGSLKQEVTDLQKKMIALAAELQSQEDKASRAEEKIFALTVQEKKLAAAADAERAKQGETLSALVRIAREPPTSLALRYDHPVDAARAAMLMGAALPSLERRAKNLGEELAALRDVRKELQGEREELARALAQLEQDRLDLDIMTAEKKEAQLAALDLAAQMKDQRRALAKNAKNVEVLLEKLERESAKARTVQPKAKPVEAEARNQAVAALTPNVAISSVKGDLLLPVRGRLVSRFGEAERTGGKTKGIMLQTRSRAQVIAPHGGEVLFSGPFKGYGQVLIISAGEGYHILLAGLARIDSVPGQFLLRGEPVGQMGSSDQAARLYIEIRDKGTPVNPALWLAMNQGKARG